MVTRCEDKEYALEKKLKEIDESSATPEEIAEYRTRDKVATNMSCIMLATITVELQKSYEDYYPCKMHQDLMGRYH